MIQTADTYFITYTNEAGKSVSAWLSKDKSPNDFSNVTYTEKRPIAYTEVEGKTLKLIGVEDSYCNYTWLKDTALSDYEEVDIPEDKEEKAQDNENKEQKETTTKTSLFGKVISIFK